MQQNVEQQKNDVLEIDIGRLLQTVWQLAKRFWLLILLMVALFAAAVAFVMQKNYTPSYKAYCTFAVHVNTNASLTDTNSLYSVYYDQDLAAHLDATFSYLVNGGFLLDDIKEYMGTKTIDGTIHASSIEGSNIFILTTYSSAPEKAGALLDALMAVYYDDARFVVGDMVTEVIEGPIISQTPHNAPNRVKGIILSVILGLVLSASVLVVYALLRRTVMKPSDLEAHLNMQCFGVVPLLQSKRNLQDNPASVSASREQGLYRESIRGIARKLEHSLASRKAKVIVVTSTAAGEGKSSLSLSLAENFAHWGKKVVLLDGDLRKPSLARYCGFKQETFPLEKVLSGQAAFDTVLRQKRDGKLTLVPNSVPAKNPTVVVDSAPMKELIRSFADQADLVIIDTPPCGQFSDASLYQQYADGILYVVQQDRMTIRQILEAAENLQDADNKLLGYVLNGAQQIAQGYGKYGYGKYSYGKYSGYGGYSKYGKYGKYGHYEKMIED